MAECYILNGHVDKCDGNFITGFRMNNLTGTNLWVGAHMQNAADMSALRANRITGFLNLMTPNQMVERGIDWPRMQQELRHEGVQTIVHCPVDMDSTANHEQVFEAAQRLNDLVYHKKCRVFCQSQAGLTSAPTVALAYLTLFKEVDNWESLSHTSELITKCVSYSQ